MAVLARLVAGALRGLAEQDAGVGDRALVDGNGQGGSPPWRTEDTPR